MSERCARRCGRSHRHRTHAIRQRAQRDQANRAMSYAEVFEETRAGLSNTRQRIWASLPARLTMIRRAFSDGAGNQLGRPACL